MGLIDRTISLTLPAIPKPVVRYFSRPYVAGTTMEEALAAVRELASQGAMATLDILGEFVSREEEATANTEAYIALLQRIEREGLGETHVSVKLTALGLLLDKDGCLENMRRLTRQAETGGNFVRIDMEDSGCTDDTLAIYQRLRDEFGNDRVGVVLQSRLRPSRFDTVSSTSQTSAQPAGRQTEASTPVAVATGLPAQVIVQSYSSGEAEGSAEPDASSSTQASPSRQPADPQRAS